MSVAEIKITPKLVNMFSEPRGSLRFRVAHGGRGSGKSFTFALMAAIWGYAETLRILCTREMQNSIKESMHAEIKNAIDTYPWLSNHYTIGENFIRGKNGTEFLFKGLRHNISSIKSMAQIDLCIVEEAADIPKTSWESLLPTIRAPRSEIWCVYNPKNKNDPVDVMFRCDAPPRSMVVEVNHSDNPWFPSELEEQRLHAQKVMDDALYRHIWEGAYYEQSDAQVFRGKYTIREFEPKKEWDGPYFGMDFGFAQDPSTSVKCWIADRCLYIEYDAGKVGLELDDTADFFRQRIPEIEDHAMRADSARPESISYLKRNGLPRIVGVKKVKGSVEDGVEYIKSYDQVIIHPRCTGSISEFRLYSYKVDRLSGDILPVIVDTNNHYIDAIRYALQPLIERREIPKIKVQLW